MRALQSTEGHPRYRGGFIYCVFNMINGKVYVGQTTRDMDRRPPSHLKGYSCSEHLNRAVAKYGSDAFIISRLVTVSTQKELDDAEIYWISHFDSTNQLSGYNSRAGGSGGGRLSDEIKRKLSNVRTGFEASSETKKKMSKSFSGSGNGFFGKKHHPETIEKMRSKLSQMFHGEENPFFGQKHSEESRVKMSVSHRGQKMHPNTRDAIAEANKGNQYTKGHRLSIEHLEKLSSLTIDDVTYIRQNPKGLTTKQLADELHVPYDTVYRVVKFKTWRNV